MYNNDILGAGTRPLHRHRRQVRFPIVFTAALRLILVCFDCVRHSDGDNIQIDQCRINDRQVNSVVKTMDFGVKTMSFVVKAMSFVVKTMSFVVKTMNLYSKSTTGSSSESAGAQTPVRSQVMNLTYKLMRYIEKP